MSDPWAFGWTQLFTLAGLIISVCVSIAGLRTFAKWRREKVEEKKIDVALEALAIAYQSKFVFEHIRGPMAYSYEWADMPERVSDTNDRRNARGAYYVPLKRLDQHKGFFEGLWKIQPLAMALFGPGVEDVFLKVHQARRDIEVAAQMSMESIDDPYRGTDQATIELYKQFRVDIYGHGGQYTKEGDRVGAKLKAFQSEMEAIFRPVVYREYREVKECDGERGHG